MISTAFQADLSKLAELPARLQKNVYKRAIRAGAKILQQDIKANAAFRSGALKQSIKTKVDSAKGEVVAYGVVGPASAYRKLYQGKEVQPSRYAAPLERGPFARPFLMPAWDRGRGRYLDAIEEVIAREINAALGS